MQNLYGKTGRFRSPFDDNSDFKHNELGAEKFINRLIDYLQPQPHSVMLELACGNGRHALLLASKGFDVTGIDVSIDSISDAKENERENLHFFVHDTRLPFWVNYFNYAFSFFSSFGNFNTRRAVDNSIRTVAHSLKPNGIFVIDYPNFHFAEGYPDHQAAIETVNSKALAEDDYHKKMIIESEALEKPLAYQDKEIQFSPRDFAEMLTHHHMQIQQVFGDDNLNDYYAEKSPGMIIVAKKIVH